MNLAFLKKNLLYQFKNTKELVSSLKKIHEILTSKREDLDKYLDNDKLVSAYTYFYSYTNSSKLPRILERVELDKRIENLVDIGCGPGTYTIEFAREIESLNSVHGVDISEIMLKQARRLNTDSRVSFMSPLHKKKLKNNLLFFGHSLNEMSIETIEDYVNFYEPIQIIAVMPGTSFCFDKIIQVREKLLNQGFGVSYPCPSNHSCPIKGSKDWCHQYIVLNHEQEIKSIMTDLGVDRRNNPAIIFSFNKGLSDHTEPIVIRNYPIRKYGYEFEVCSATGETNSIDNLKVMKKGLSSSEKRVMKQKVSGDYVKQPSVDEDLRNKD